MIRLAEPADLAYLPGIDVAAGAVFRDVGMAAVADDDPPPLTWFETHVAAGRVWVWGKRKQPPAAFCLVEVVDGTVHHRTDLGPPRPCATRDRRRPDRAPRPVGT